MKKIFAVALFMSLVWSGAEGQDPDIFDSGFEVGSTSEWTVISDGGSDRAPTVVIIAPVSWSCDVYLDKRTCNDQFLCRWDNRNQICVPDDDRAPGMSRDSQ